MALRTRPRKNRRPQAREETLPERIAREQSTLHKDPRVLQSIQKQRDLLAVLPQHELTFTAEVREEAERICEVLGPFGFTFADVVLLVDELGAGSEALTAKISQLIEDNLDNPDGRKSEWISTTKKRKSIVQKPRPVQTRQSTTGRTRNNVTVPQPLRKEDSRETHEAIDLQVSAQGFDSQDGLQVTNEASGKESQRFQSEIGEQDGPPQKYQEDCGLEKIHCGTDVSKKMSEDAVVKPKLETSHSEGWRQVAVSAWSAADDTNPRIEEQRPPKVSSRLKTTSQTTDMSTSNGEAVAAGTTMSPKTGQRGAKKTSADASSTAAPPSVTTPPPPIMSLQTASVVVEDMPTVTSLSSSQMKRSGASKANWGAVEAKEVDVLSNGNVASFHSFKSKEEKKAPTSRQSEHRQGETGQSDGRQVNHQQSEGRVTNGRQIDQVEKRPAEKKLASNRPPLQRHREVPHATEPSNAPDVPKIKSAPRRQQAPSSRSQAASHPVEPMKCLPPARHEAPRMVESPPPAAHPVCIPSSAVAFHARPRPSVTLPAHVESPPSVPSPNYCFGTYRWETQPAKSARGKFNHQKPAHYISHTFGSFAPPPFYPPPFPSAAATTSTTRRENSLAAQNSITGSRQPEGSAAYYQQQNVFDFYYQPTPSPTAYYETASAAQKGQANDPFEQASTNANSAASVKYPPGLQSSSNNQQNYGQLTAARSPMGPFGPAPVCRTMQQQQPPSYNVRPPMILSYAPQYGAQGTAGTTATYASSASMSGVIDQTSSGSDDHQNRLWRVTDDAYTVAQLTSALQHQQQQQQSLQHQSSGNTASEPSALAAASQRWRLKAEGLLHHPQHHSNAASSFIANAASSLAASHHFAQSGSTYSAFAAPPPGLSTGNTSGLGGGSGHQYGYSNADTFGLVGSRHFN